MGGGMGGGGGGGDLSCPMMLHVIIWLSLSLIS